MEIMFQKLVTVIPTGNKCYTSSLRKLHFHKNRLQIAGTFQVYQHNEWKIVKKKGFGKLWFQDMMTFTGQVVIPLK